MKEVFVVVRVVLIYVCLVVTAVECPVPESPPFGTAVYTSCQYNSVVSYECKYGYTLVGNATRRCGADRKWSGSPPKCQGRRFNQFLWFCRAFNGKKKYHSKLPYEVIIH